MRATTSDNYKGGILKKNGNKHHIKLIFIFLE